jgi:hypothetical protein
MAQKATVYDIVSGDACGSVSNDDVVPEFPFPDTTLCEDDALTLDSNEAVFHLALSGTILGFEDSVGFDGSDKSSVRFYDVSEWASFSPLNHPNFTDNNVRHQQDVILSANGTMAAVLSGGATDDDLDTIRIFRIEDKALAEFANIQGNFDSAVGGIVFSSDGTLIAATVHSEFEDLPDLTVMAVQVYSLQNDSTWVELGSAINKTSREGQASVSNGSNRVLVIGDSGFGDENEGHVRIFTWRNSEW